MTKTSRSSPTLRISSGYPTLRRTVGSFLRRNKYQKLIQPAPTARDFSGFVFVCGLHRSGTTLLEHHIRAHFHIAGLRADVPESEGQHLQDVMPIARDHGGPGLFAFSPEMHLDAIGAIEAERARDRILSCWTPFIDGDDDVLLEKSPPNLTRINWLRSVFPGAVFVILTRDPRAAASATYKWAQTSVLELMYHWHVAYSAALDAWGDDCVAVRYEDFCDNPERIIETLANTGKLARRPAPLAIEDRFANPLNSNARYIDALGHVAFGPGAWTQLGYGF